MAKAIFYSDCSELPIYNFDKILKTKDYSYLVSNGEEFDEEKADEKWKEIYEEYLKLADDQEALMYFSTYSELLYLETRFAIASKVLKQLIVCSDVPKVVDIFIDTLKDWKYKIDRKKPLNEEIERVLNQIKLSENKIRLKKDELEKYKPDDETEPMSLTQQVVKLEQGLNRNEINPKTTSVEKWVNLIKELKEISKARKKAMAKKY